MIYTKTKEKVNVSKENIEDDLNHLNSLDKDVFCNLLYFYIAINKKEKIGYKSKDEVFLGYKTHVVMKDERSHRDDQEHFYDKWSFQSVEDMHKQHQRYVSRENNMA